MAKYLRRIITITAYDSPNVKLALEEKKRGLRPSGRLVVPGVLPWDEFQKRMITWDDVRKEIGLFARFYEGRDVLLFPPQWLDAAEEYADLIERTGVKRKALGIGVDPAEGGDKTAMCAVDEYGVVDLVSKKTPNTAVIRREVLAFMHKWSCPAENVVFDRGGGGQEHADYLREMGYKVRTVGFGEAISRDPRRGIVPLSELVERKEEKYVYKNRRSELYGVVSILLDPEGNSSSILGGSSSGHPHPGVGTRFGIHRKFKELRRQLAPIPKTYDREGRLELLPKRKKEPRETRKTLVDLIGCSPDEADAFVLAVHGMVNKVRRVRIGAAI